MRLLATVSVLVAASTIASLAAAQSANFLINSRKGAMTLQGKYFGTVLAMARGTSPYDAKIVQRNAEYLEVISQMPWDDFQPATLGLPNTRAKEAIAKEADKFKQLSEELQGNLRKLSAAAKGGDQAGVRTAALAVGRNCNGCHEQFSTYEFRFKFE